MHLFFVALIITVAMEMARAALTPTSQAQQLAIAWLEDYAARHGDDSPTREEIHLSAMRKTDIYIDYKREFSKEFTGNLMDSPTVNLKKFLELCSISSCPPATICIYLWKVCHLL